MSRVALASADVKFRRSGHGSQAMPNNSFQMVRYVTIYKAKETFFINKSIEEVKVVFTSKQARAQEVKNIPMHNHDIPYPVVGLLKF